MATKNPSAPLAFTTLIHMIIVKLSSSNYLIWHSQILPLIESQDLVGHVDGSIVPPPKFDSPKYQTPNDKYLAWKAIDQRLLCLLRSSLTEEALAEIVGFSTAHDVWLALETTFNHKYKTQEIHLKDELQSTKRATRSVTDIARVFKGSATSYTPLDVQLTIPTKCTGFFVDLVLNFQVSLLPRWPSLRFHHLLTLSPEPRALNYSKNHMNQLRHLLLLLPSLSQVATGSRGINHTGGPILDSNLAPLDSSPVISTQPRTQLWPSTSPSTLPYILH